MNFGSDHKKRSIFLKLTRQVPDDKKVTTENNAYSGNDFQVPEVSPSNGGFGLRLPKLAISTEYSFQLSAKPRNNFPQ